MAVIDTSRDLPESCEKCWKKDCSIYGTEWMSISSTDTYRNSRDKNCPLKSVIGLAEDIATKSNMSIDDISTAFEIIDKYCGGEDEKTND